MSRRTVAGLTLDAIVGGRGDRPVWALQLQVLRELAQHAGHADVLRGQVFGQTRSLTDRSRRLTAPRRNLWRPTDGSR